MLAALLLTACGEPADQSGMTASVSDAGTDALSQAGMDWWEKEMLTADAVADSPLYITAYETVDYEEPEETMACEYRQVAYGDVFYVLDTYYTRQESVSYFQQLGAEEGAGERILLDAGMWEIENGGICGMDIVDADRCVFWVSSNGADGAAGQYYMVYTDHQGQMLEALELTDILREYGIWESQDYLGIPLGCDEEGNLYLHDADSHTLYLLDGSGGLAASYTYRAEDDINTVESFRTAGGERVIVCGMPGEWEWILMDAGTGTVSRRSVTGIGNVQRWYGMEGDILYYAADRELIGWNLATGARQKLAELKEVAMDTDIAGLAVQRMGDAVRLLVTEKEKGQRYMMLLAENPPAAESEITVMDLRGGDSYLPERVAGFSRENPAYGVKYQAVDQEEEIHRLLMETVNGQGPDLLFLSRQDMESLQANDVLGDLGQLISPDTMEVLLPGAIEMGTYEEKMVGIPLSVNVRTLITRRDYWQGDTWTMEDILSVLKQNSEVQGLFVDMAGLDEYSYNLYYMLGMDIRNSPFIRDGSCSFDSREFRDILTLVKEMTQRADNNSTPMNRIAPLTEGKYLGIGYLVYNMKNFCDVYEQMGDTVNLVGYPSDTDSHHFLSDYGMLAVNQNAMDKPGIKELVNDLLSLESQQYLSYQISVRTDIPESQLAYHSAGKIYYWQSPNGTGYPLPAKEDGSSYLEEYLELLESAVPLSSDSDDILNLVMEEADGYFYSDKNIDSVVDSIQKRVQLYLDEQK